MLPVVVTPARVVPLGAILVVIEEGSVLAPLEVVVVGVPMVVVKEKGAVVPIAVVEGRRVCGLTSWERRHQRVNSSP